MIKLLIVPIAALVLSQTVVRDAPCVAPRESATLVDAGYVHPVPVTALAGRRFVELCNTANSPGTLKCRIDQDGGTFAYATNTSAGQVLVPGMCKGYAITDQTVICCMSNVDSTVAATTECK